MATFENTVLIARPIEEVVGFLADLENVPRWNEAIVETGKVSEGPVGVGPSTSRSARCRAAAKRAWRSPPMPSPSAGDPGPARAVRVSPVLCLDATGAGTRVTNTVAVELRGPGRLLGRLAVPRVREAVAANLKKLKELLEG